MTVIAERQAAEKKPQDVSDHLLFELYMKKYAPIVSQEWAS